MASEIRVARVSADDADFLKLVRELDAYLSIFNGADDAVYSGFNKLDSVYGAVVVYKDDEGVGCGAFRDLGNGLGEVKRMFVKPESRGLGVAYRALVELEDWAREAGLRRFQLETGAELPDARRLYERSGYQYIPNYEPYVGLDRSVCMAKDLR